MKAAQSDHFLMYNGLLNQNNRLLLSILVWPKIITPAAFTVKTNYVQKKKKVF